MTGSIVYLGFTGWIENSMGSDQKSDGLDLIHFHKNMNPDIAERGL